MSFETVDYQVTENVAIIAFNRPESLNALSSRLVGDLTSAIKKASEDKVRAVVLTGNGRAFCSGGDLVEMLTMQKKGTTTSEPLLAMHAAIRLIRETPIPFIAAVNGVCAGAGTNFALACDLVFADENAVFNEAFVKIGLSPDCGGSFFLPRVIGEKLAAEMFMTGDSIDAKRAVEIGMINRVVTAETLQTEAFSMAKRLANMPTSSIGRIKKMLNATFSNSFDDQLELEHQFQIESGKSDDFREGVAAFIEKRKPVFSGD
jgi:2-(1,2-epoxy-1,2-dihydrophenyl)acetyl-CoA isomerase